jgi:hypothetical protein
MKMFKVHLTRDYVVDIQAEDEDEAGRLTEWYISGGKDESTEKDRLTQKFKIIKIKPTVNEASYIEEVQEW